MSKLSKLENISKKVNLEISELAITIVSELYKQTKNEIRRKCLMQSDIEIMNDVKKIHQKITNSLLI